MSYTKRQFIEAAFEEAGLASYIFILTPDQLQSALRRLDGMMATWEGKSILIAWPFATSPEDSELDTETNAPLDANEAIYLNLAPRVAPMFGKTLSNDTQKNGRQAYNQLLGQFTKAKAKKLPTTLTRGQGSKYWELTNDPFILAEVDDGTNTSS